MSISSADGVRPGPSPIRLLTAFSKPLMFLDIVAFTISTKCGSTAPAISLNLFDKDNFSPKISSTLDNNCPSPSLVFLSLAICFASFRFRKISCGARGASTRLGGCHGSASSSDISSTSSTRIISFSNLTGIPFLMPSDGMVFSAGMSVNMSIGLRETSLRTTPASKPLTRILKVRSKTL